MRLTIAYLASYVLSALGNSIATVALPLIILQATGSALGAGTVAAATVLPALAGGILMGVVIDRVNRRTSSIITDMISGLAVAALPLIDLITDLNVGWFILFGAVGALGDIPGITARETLLPAIVRTSPLSSERLIGLRESLGAAAIVIGPAAAGLLVGVLGGSTVLWVTAGLSFAAAAVTLLIPHRAGATPHEVIPTRRNVFTEFREGFNALFGRPFLVMLLMMTFVAGMVTSSFQGLILPVYFTRIEAPALLGLVLSALALGLLLGSVIYAVLAKPGRGRRAWLGGGLSGAAIGIGMMATLANIPIVLVGAFVTGMASGLFTSLAGVLMLERIPDPVRGRVMSVQNAAVTIAPSIGIVIASVLTEVVSLQIAAVVAAAAWAVMVISVLVAKPMKDLAPSALE
ncbi:MULTISPECIES: MFS transporter [unclassified Microbacterium]|uniref:MFS transporter n=1 Tax=unclassified Microbacterium TaxID=2609290 RepID=UPI000EA89A4D|nr:MULTISPECIES: MFS transporter [unclassified Microbacterium]MBT2486431.1 MFS transporter [Microbacterium sp. ISL-108]RKN69131.1 MFS transporter [Microbacterium sp. CGR2]